jgi:hypothetical protein
MTSSFAFQASTRILTWNRIGPDRFETTSEGGFRNVRFREPDLPAPSGWTTKRQSALVICLVVSEGFIALHLPLNTPGNRQSVFTAQLNISTKSITAPTHPHSLLKTCIQIKQLMQGKSFYSTGTNLKY